MGGVGQIIFPSFSSTSALWKVTESRCCGNQSRSNKGGFEHLVGKKWLANQNTPLAVGIHELLVDWTGDEEIFNRKTLDSEVSADLILTTY
jgi:hypothetical protein